MLQVTWDGLTDGWLKFPAAIRKGKRADKVFKLGDDTLRALDRIREPKRELIFPWDRRASVLYDHYNRILAGAGLPTDSKSKFHRLRRSAASHYKASGGDATELLDHADARVTKKYLDPRIVQQENACDVLFRIVPGEPIDPPTRPQAAAVRHASPAVQPVAYVAREPIPVDRPGLPEDVTVVEYARYLQGTDRVSDSWGRCLLNAATQLQSWNGRPVEMRRLSEETVSGFVGFLARDGSKASKQRDSRSMLRSLWRHGQIDGIAFGSRVDRPARLPAQTRSYVSQKSAYGPILPLFESLVATRHWLPSTAKRCHKALVRLAKSLGRPVKLSDLTPPRIERRLGEMAESRSPLTLKRDRYALLQLAEHAHQDFTR